MKKEIYTDADYDYPHCGGIIVTEGYKNTTVEVVSNYTGNYSFVVTLVGVNLNRDWSDPDYRDLFYWRSIDANISKIRRIK